MAENQLPIEVNHPSNDSLDSSTITQCQQPVTVTDQPSDCAEAVLRDVSSTVSTSTPVSGSASTTLAPGLGSVFDPATTSTPIQVINTDTSCNNASISVVPTLDDNTNPPSSSGALASETLDKNTQKQAPIDDSEFSMMPNSDPVPTAGNPETSFIVEQNTTQPSTVSIAPQPPPLTAEAIAKLAQILPTLTSGTTPTSLSSASGALAPLAVLSPSSASALSSTALSTPANPNPEQEQDEVTIAYEKYLEEEKRLIDANNWDPNLPEGSRLFVGNLSERTTKKDLFRILSPYGDIIQILLKGTYGFVQFTGPVAPVQAIKNEQGHMLKGRAMSLEVSTGKPFVGEHDRPGRRQRSQKPPTGNQSKQRQQNAPRRRGRDRRGMSPPGNHQPPPRQGRGYNPGGGPPLPQRFGQQVPEVQIIAIDEPDRNYIKDCEATFRSRRVSVDVMSVSARFNIPAGVRQMVGEGVRAVCFLDRRMQVTGVVSIQIFEPLNGPVTGPLRYDEYNEVTMDRAADIFISRTRGNFGRQPASGPGYGGPVTPQSPLSSFPPAPMNAPAQAHLASLLSTVDPSTLATLLTQAQKQQHQQSQPLQTQPLSMPSLPHQLRLPPVSQQASVPLPFFPQMSNSFLPQSQPALQGGPSNEALASILKQLQRK